MWLTVLGTFVALGEANEPAQGSAKTCPSCCHAGQSWGPSRGTSQVAQTEVAQSLQQPQCGGLQGALSPHGVSEKGSPLFTCEGSKSSLCIHCGAVAALGQGLGLDSAVFLQLGPNHPP